MNYFLDAEFLEGPQKTLFGRTKPTIDLISIALVSEDGWEYYEVSKDFNLKEAWNRYDNKVVRIGEKDYKQKVYWIRENVLKPIWKDLSAKKQIEDHGTINGSVSASREYTKAILSLDGMDRYFTYKNLRRLINKYGKTNKQIADEIKQLVYTTSQINDPDTIANWEQVKHLFPVEFYAYYADYDWVAFCWLFGKMVDLPKGFPMYCRDLKQMLDLKWSIDAEAVEYLKAIQDTNQAWPKSEDMEDIFHVEDIKEHPNYPKQFNEHIALEDARWNKKLYDFLRTI